jgi:hypothetical protein
MAARTQLPTLSGEVTLNIRSMYRNRSGRPRSEASRGTLAAPPAPATVNAARASRSLPDSRAPSPSAADAPASPPVKKYQATSQVQTGSLRIGRP